MSESKSLTAERLSARSRASSTTSVMSTDGLLSHGVLHYWPSIISLLTFGLVDLLSIKLGGFFGPVLTLLNVVFLYEWIKLHSEKLTRKERIFFDETNILQTSKNFEFNLGPILEDTTPGGQCCGSYPRNAGILAELFKDDRQDDMQKFYQEHYGGMYTNSRKVEAEEKATRGLHEDNYKKK